MQPKYYQGFDPTKPSFSKIVKLKYIDDISSEDYIMYVFENGEECNQEFIGQVDEPDPLQRQCMYVEVLSPVYKWSLSKKVYEPAPPQFATNENGTFEAPDFSYDAEKGTSRTPGSMRVEAIPPRLPNNWQVPPMDDYLLSQHPELEYADTVPEPAVRQQKTTVQRPQSNPEPVYKPEPQTQQPTRPQSIEPQLTQHIQQQSLVQTTSAHIDIDRMSQTIEFIDIKHKNKTIRLSKEEFVNSVIATKAEPKQLRAGEDIIKKENMLIKSMIDMSKKKICEISLKVKLELPPKEVYETISKAYDEQYAHEFVRSLTARIPHNGLIESLANGLSIYYSGQEMSKQPSSDEEENFEISD